MPRTTEMARSFDLVGTVGNRKPCRRLRSVCRCTMQQRGNGRYWGGMSEQTALAVCADGVKRHWRKQHHCWRGMRVGLVLADDPLPEGYAVSATQQHSLLIRGEGADPKGRLEQPNYSCFEKRYWAVWRVSTLTRTEQSSQESGALSAKPQSEITTAARKRANGWGSPQAARRTCHNKYTHGGERDEMQAIMKVR